MPAMKRLSGGGLGIGNAIPVSYPVMDICTWGAG